MDQIDVMVNGLPGKTAVLVAKAILKNERFWLLPYSLTVTDIKQKTKTVIVGKMKAKVYLVKHEERENRMAALHPKSTIVVDVTHSKKIMENIEFYCEHKMPFVVGMTGVNLALAKKLVKSAGIIAVIGSNVSMPLVVTRAISFLFDKLGDDETGKVFGMDDIR